MPKLPDIPSELWNMFQSSKLEDETQDAFSTNQFLDETLDLGDDIIQKRLKDEAQRTYGPRLEQEFLGSLRDEQEYNQALDDADQIEQGFGIGVSQVVQEYQNSLPTPEEEFSQFADELGSQIAPPERGGPQPNPNPPPFFVEPERPPVSLDAPPPSLGGAEGIFPDVPYGVAGNVEPGDFSLPGRPPEPTPASKTLDPAGVSTESTWETYAPTKFERQVQQAQQIQQARPVEEVSPWVRVGEAIGEAIQSAISGLVPTNEAKQQASQDLRTRTLEDPSTPLPFEGLGRTVTSASQAAVRDIATNAASGVSPSQYLKDTSLRLAEDAVVGTVSAAQASPLVQAAVKGVQDTFQYVQEVYQSPEVQEGIRRGRAQQTPTGQRFLGNISANMLAPDVERIWKPIEEHQVVPAWTDYWADRTSEKRNIAVAKTLQAVPDVTSETLQELIGGGEEGRVFLNPLGMHDTPVIGGLGQFMGVQKNARFGVGDVVANFVGRGAGVPGAALEAAQWAGMVGVVIDTTKSVQERALALGVPGAILGTQHLLRFITPPAVQMIKAAGGSVQNAIDALSTKFGRKLTEPEVIGVVREWESGTYLNVPESTGTEAPASGSPSYGPAMGIVERTNDAAPQYDRYYHGTGSDFARPDAGKFDPNGLFGPGYYVTSDARVAGSGDWAKPGYAEQQSPQVREVLDAERISRTAREKADELQRSGLIEAAQRVRAQADGAEVRAAARGYELAANKAPGPNIRPVDVPGDLRLLDADAPLTPRDIQRIARALDDPSMRRDFIDSFSGMDYATGEEVHRTLGALLGSDLQRANATIAQAGYDGIRYRGGKRIPMNDASGNPIEHTALVVFPESLDKIRNATAGTPGGLLPGTTPQLGTATRIGGQALGSGVGAAYQESQQEGSTPESILEAGLQAAGNSLGSAAASRLIRNPTARRVIGRELGSVARAVEENASDTPGGFQTALGSTYQVHADGTTTRNKAARDLPGHEGDFGPKPRSEATYYLSEDDARALAPPQGTHRLVDNGDGTLSMVTQREDGVWGVAPSQRNIPYETSPREGVLPLEVWGKSTLKGRDAYKTLHFGNEITAVEPPLSASEAGGGKGSSPPPSSPEPTPEPTPEPPKRAPATGLPGFTNESAQDFAEVRPGRHKDSDNPWDTEFSHNEILDAAMEDPNGLLESLPNYEPGKPAKVVEALKYYSSPTTSDEAMMTISERSMQNMAETIQALINRADEQGTSLKTSERAALERIMERDYLNRLDEPAARREIAQAVLILHNSETGRALNQNRRGFINNRALAGSRELQDVSDVLLKDVDEGAEKLASAIRDQDSGRTLTDQQLKDLERTKEQLGTLGKTLDPRGEVENSRRVVSKGTENSRRALGGEPLEGGGTGTGTGAKRSSKPSGEPSEGEGASTRRASKTSENDPKKRGDNQISLYEKLSEFDQEIGTTGTYLDPSAPWQDTYEGMIAKITELVQQQAEKKESRFARMSPEQQQAYVSKQVHQRLGRSLFELEKESQGIKFNTPVSDAVKQQVRVALEGDYVNSNVKQARELFQAAKKDMRDRIKNGEDPEVAWDNARVGTGLDDALQRLAEYNNRGELQQQRLDRSINQWKDDEFARLAKDEVRNAERREIAEITKRSRSLLSDAVEVPKEMSQATQDAINASRDEFLKTLEELRAKGETGKARAHALEVEYEKRSGQNITSRTLHDKARDLYAEISGRIKAAKNSTDLEQVEVDSFVEALRSLRTQEGDDLARKLMKTAVTATNQKFLQEQADLARKVISGKVSLLHGTEFLDLVDNIAQTPGGREVADRLLIQAISRENMKAVQERAQQIWKIRSQRGPGAGEAVTQLLQEMKDLGQGGKEKAESLRRDLIKSGVTAMIEQSQNKGVIDPTTAHQLVTRLSHMTEAQWLDPQVLRQIIVDEIKHPGKIDKMFDMWHDYTVTNVLSSPEVSGIAGINTLGGLLNTASLIATSVIDNILETPFALVSGKREIASTGAMLRGMQNAQPLAGQRAMEIIRKGYADDILLDHIRLGHLKDVHFEAIGGPLGRVLHTLSTRPMAAGDIYFRTTVEMGVLTGLAQRKSEDLARQGIRRSAEDILRAAPREFPEMIKMAKAEADAVLYTKDLPKWLRGLDDAHHSDKAGVRFLASLAIMFYKVPTNIALETLKMSPPGLMYEAGKLAVKSGQKIAGKDVSQRELVQSARKLLVGGALTYYIMNQYQQGNIKGTGAVPGHEDRFGDAPYGAAIRVNGQWKSVASLPIGPLVGMLADTMEFVEHKQTQLLNNPRLVGESGNQRLDYSQSVPEFLAAFAEGGLRGTAQGIASIPLLRATYQLTGPNPEKAITGLASSLINRNIPLNGLLSYMAAVGDKYERDTGLAPEADGGWGETIRRRVANTLPGVRQMVPRKVTQLGDPSLESRYAGNTGDASSWASKVASQYISPPLFGSRDKPVEKSPIFETYRKYRVPLSDESQSYQGLPLDAAKRRGIQEIYGDLMAQDQDILKEIVNNPESNALLRRKQLRLFSSARHRRAMELYLDKYAPSLRENAQIKKYLETVPG